MSITYSECVFVGLVIQHEKCLRHIVTCGLSVVPYFSTLSLKRKDFREKSYWTQNLCFDFSYKVRFKYFSFYEDLSQALP